ncbi:hypothetical protein AAII07_37475 [Microvirga sp. 0TCS3.31]
MAANQVAAVDEGSVSGAERPFDIPPVLRGPAAAIESLRRLPAPPVSYRICRDG